MDIETFEDLLQTRKRNGVFIAKILDEDKYMVGELSVKYIGTHDFEEIVYLNNTRLSHAVKLVLIEHARKLFEYHGKYICTMDIGKYIEICNFITSVDYAMRKNNKNELVAMESNSEMLNLIETTISAIVKRADESQ